MQLDWVSNYEENRLTFEIDNLKYTTVDGGQNIDKYVDGEFNKRIRQFPDKPADWLQPHMSPPMVPEFDEWSDEINWLLKQYPEQLGERCYHHNDNRDSYQYKERDGSITTETFVRGQGVNNWVDLISVNRLGMPASVQERWDWIEIAKSLDKVENAPNGLAWSKHKDTGEILRHGQAQNCPCHVFPQIYVPVVILKEELESDVAKFGGRIAD